MKLSNEAIKEFQRLYKKHFGKLIDRKTAEVEASRLIALVSLIQPKPTEMTTGSQISEEEPDGH